MSGEFVVKVPDVGEGVAEAEVVAWHVQPGDTIDVDQAIVEVLTDKATVEIPSPVAGTITWVCGDVGDVVAVGSDLVHIDRHGGGAASGGGAGTAGAAAGDGSASAVGVDDDSTPTSRASSSPTGDDTAEYDVPTERRAAAINDDTAEIAAPVAPRTAPATAHTDSPGSAHTDSPGSAHTDSVDADEREPAIGTTASTPAPTRAPAVPTTTPDALHHHVASQPTATRNASHRDGASRPPTAPGASHHDVARHHDVASRPQAAPAVRKRALEAGADLRQVAGSGPAGRVTHEDLDAYLAGTARHDSAAGDGARVDRIGSAGDASFVAAADEVIDEPIRGIRRRIAAAVSDSAARIAHITYVDDVDLTALQELRRQLNGSVGSTGTTRPRLTLLPFLVRALVAAVREYPQFNARFDDAAGVLHRHLAVHVGIAAQTPNGLLVPVLRHAEGHDVFGAAVEIERLATAAREGTISAAELNGSTITISSLGAVGGLMSTPIINGNEVAIVGVNKLEQRPVWNEQRQAFEPRAMMNLSSSFDHRIIDGWDAAQFVQHVKSGLQSPALLLLP